MVFHQIAHRGIPSQYPENSLAGFHYVEKLNLYALETDIQLTKDNVPVLFHDKHLDRTTNTQGLLCDFTLDQLNAEVRLSNGERIPTLYELLKLFQNTTTKLYLEIINPKALPYVIPMVKGFNLGKQVIISSFIHSVLIKAKKAWPTCSTMALFECEPIDSVGFLKAAQANEAGVGFDSVTPKLIQDLHKANIPVLAWTVNSPSEKKRAQNLGLDGIFTDYPI